jgi:2-keto-3-deoxy-galactonokinase
MSRLGSKNEDMMRFVHQLPGNFHGKNDNFCEGVRRSAQNAQSLTVTVVTIRTGQVGVLPHASEANESR